MELEQLTHNQGQLRPTTTQKDNNSIQSMYCTNNDHSAGHRVALCGGGDLLPSLANLGQYIFRTTYIMFILTRKIAQSSWLLQLYAYQRVAQSTKAATNMHLKLVTSYLYPVNTIRSHQPKALPTTNTVITLEKALGESRYSPYKFFFLSFR